MSKYVYAIVFNTIYTHAHAHAQQLQKSTGGLLQIAQKHKLLSV